MRPQTWKRLGLALGGLAVAGGLVYAMLPAPVAVDLAEVSEGEMRVTVDEEGKTRIRDVYVVSAPFSGKVLRSPLHVGDEIAAGVTPVAVLVPASPSMLDVRARSELEAQVSVAESAVSLAEAELSQAESESRLADAELARTRTLAKRGVVPERNLDRADTDARVKRDAVARARSALKLREDELTSARSRLIGPVANGSPGAEAASGGSVTLTSPASGRVLRLPVESEAVVSQGTALVEIGDPADLEVIVDLLSADAVKVETGAEAVIESWGGPRTLAARVRRIEPSGFTKVSALGIEEQRVRVVLDLTDPPESYRALGHDYRVFVRIEVWRSDKALQVPLGALFRDGDRWAVYKLELGRARLVHLKLGERNPNVAEVLGGLAAGDRVVLHPSDRVTDGGKVEPRVTQ